MTGLTQRLLPGLVGISTYVDFVYQQEMQRSAVAMAGTSGPINQLSSVTVTLNFSLLIENLAAGRRGAAEEQVADASERLQAAGCDFIVVTSGTTSTLTGLARERTSIPIADIAAACWRFGSPLSPAGLLATSYTVKGRVFHEVAEKNGTELIVPDEQVARRLDAMIFQELVAGRVTQAGIDLLARTADELLARGARSIILGNTDMTLTAAELGHRIKVPLIDSTITHARAAAHAAMTGEV
jgi:aspartate racemase